MPADGALRAVMVLTEEPAIELDSELPWSRRVLAPELAVLAVLFLLYNLAADALGAALSRLLSRIRCDLPGIEGIGAFIPSSFED